MVYKHTPTLLTGKLSINEHVGDQINPKDLDVSMKNCEQPPFSRSIAQLLLLTRAMNYVH